MMAINWKKSWPLVEAAIRDHNRRHVTGTRKDGKPRYDLNKVLRAPHQHLLKEMVRMYSLQLAGYKWLHMGERLPAFHTHCGELGGAMRLCKSTIHEQLQRLLQSGLVTEKEHQGRRHHFKLRFADSIIAIHPELALQRELARCEDSLPHIGNQAFAHTEAESSRQSLETCYPKKENKLPVEAVENDSRDGHRLPLPWEAEASNPASGGKELASDARLRDASWGAGKPGKAPAIRTGGADETRLRDSGKQAAVAARPAPAPVSGVFEDYAVRLLAVIVGSLYARLDFIAESQMEAICEFIARQFEGKSPEEGEAVYQDLYLRLGIAEKWVRGKPGRYLQLPRRYFDPDNPNGFNRTARWLANMRMTNQRAEKARLHFQYLSKSITAVLQSTGRHLAEGGIHSYVARRGQVADKYPHLATAFDWITLDPRCNGAGG